MPEFAPLPPLQPMSGYGRSFGDDSGSGAHAQNVDQSGPLPNTVPPGAATANNPGPQAMMPPSALPAPAPATTDAQAKRRAGAAIVLAGIGVGTGALLGGAWGAGSGLLFAGAACNALQANKLWRSDFADDRKEAIKRTVMTVVGIGAAGYLSYRAKKSRDDD